MKDLRFAPSVSIEQRQINLYLAKTYNIYAKHKPYVVIAKLSDQVAKLTGLSKDIVINKSFFHKMLLNHPNMSVNQLFYLVKTLNAPDEIFQVTKENRLNFIRKINHKLINIVSTGKDWQFSQQNVITSFILSDKKELKYLQKIKNTSKKVFTIDSGGAINSSSDMLAQVPGTGDRLPRSSESSPEINSR